MPKDTRPEYTYAVLYGMNLSLERLTATLNGLRADGKLTAEMGSAFEAFKASRQWLMELAYKAMMDEADTHTTSEIPTAKDSTE